VNCFYFQFHAEISFVGNVNKVGRGHYIVKDKGSTNGTFLDGKKLPKHSSSSEPRHIVHGSELSVGDTKFLCHIHDGMETCYLCEPGIQAPLPEESQYIIFNVRSLILCNVACKYL